jgi:hypothetical protein
MHFSQRKGLKPVAKVLQLDDVDADLRNAIWSCYHETVLKEFRGPENYLGRTSNVLFSNLESIFTDFWFSYYKQPTDTLPDDFHAAVKVIRSRFFESSWNEVYDFMEFNLEYIDVVYEDQLRTCWNTVLERENAGYRIIGRHVVEITNTQELADVVEALQTPLQGVRAHFETAVTLMSDRKSPDYRNSIKESISAVEAISRSVTQDPKATLGAALSRIQSKVAIHQALKTAFSALYGYTSDQEGIRHAMLDEPNLTFSDAKFMLVACSAFVNYIVGKAVEAGIKIAD